MERQGKVEFPGAIVFVSYGEPTEMDKIGCQGVYIERVQITNGFLFAIYWIWTEVFN